MINLKHIEDLATGIDSITTSKPLDESELVEDCNIPYSKNVRTYATVILPPKKHKKHKRVIVVSSPVTSNSAYIELSNLKKKKTRGKKKILKK